MIRNQTENAVPAATDDLAEGPRCRPSRALRFRVLSICWILPSLGAVWILFGNGARWFHASTVREGLQSVMFEQWIALGLLCLQLIFVLLALGFRRRDRQRAEIVGVEKLRAKVDNEPE